MSEDKQITLEDIDCRRLKKIKTVLDEANRLWDSAVKLIVPEYLEEFKGTNVEVVSIDPDAKAMTIKVETAGGDSS